MRTIARIVVTALALWLTTLIVGGSGDDGVWIVPYEETTAGLVFTFVLVTIIFAVVNVTLGTVIRFVSIPLRILTLGLFGIIINGFLLVVVGWFSDLIGFGLAVESFWWAVLAAIVFSILSAVLNGVLGTKKER